MAHTIVPDVDRLPWLTDEIAPTRRRGGKWPFIALVVIAMTAVAAMAYWLGAERYRATEPAKVEGKAPEAKTVLPPPAPIMPAERDIDLAPMPDVAPAPVPPPVVIRQQEIRPAIGPAERRVARRSRTGSARPVTPAKPTAEKKALQFSNPWESAGASGRMVRIGAYSSLRQGKVAWSRLAKAYPGMKKLPAVVTDIPSLRNGKVYYRLQIGTTSQAHSEVLCQRMRTIGQSCVVVDLAGARKGSGDERQPVGL